MRLRDYTNVFLIAQLFLRTAAVSQLTHMQDKDYD